MHDQKKSFVWGLIWQWYVPKIFAGNTCICVGLWIIVLFKKLNVSYPFPIIVFWPNFNIIRQIKLSKMFFCLFVMKTRLKGRLRDIGMHSMMCGLIWPKKVSYMLLLYSPFSPFLAKRHIQYCSFNYFLLIRFSTSKMI